MKNPNEIGALFDWERLRDQVLMPMKNNQSCKFQRHDWGTDKLEEWHEITACKLLIIEGVYSTRQELRKYYDRKLWVVTSYGTRLERGVHRDGEEARAMWTDTWMPAEIDYELKHQGPANADILISGDDQNLIDTASKYVRIDTL